MVQKIFSRMRITRIIFKLSMVSLLELLMVEVCFSNGDRNLFNDDCDIRGNENCYFVVSHGGYFKWKDARGKCKGKNSLPIIRNREEQTAFETYLRRLKSKYPSINAVWTLGKMKTYNQWTWINGQTLNTTISRITDNADKTHAMIEWSNRGNITMKPENPWNRALSLCHYKDRQCNGQQHEVNATNGCLIPSKYGNESWYGARNECLSKGGDLAIFTDQDIQNLKNHRFPNDNYWIGLRTVNWTWQTDRGRQASEEEVKYTNNWATQWMPTNGELCISINASNGQWIATYCSTKASVICEKRATNKTDAGHRIAATSTTTAAWNSFTTTATNAATTVSAAIGAGVVIAILCIIVILVVIWRKSKSSKYRNQMVPAQSDSETTKDKKTKENPTTATTTEERSIYADIPLVEKIANDAPEAGQKGTVYTSLDFNHGVTYAESSTLYAVTKNTQNVSGPIYAEPLNATGNGSTSAGSSPAVKIGPMGDVYALPTTNVTPSSHKTTE